MKRSRWNYARFGQLLPVLFLSYAVGCLPEDAFKQVLGENMLFTAAVAVQSFTWTLFNNLLGLI
ncbi:MAG: hypothetical protein JXQ75_23430 [Phycisphaerae bacterium]|nr:hypothetical protein [Phycisphaerae bacterium]